MLIYLFSVLVSLSSEQQGFLFFFKFHIIRSVFIVLLEMTVIALRTVITPRTVEAG